MTQEVLKTRTTSEWIARLEAADVPCAPALTRGEVLKHPQVIANQVLVETLHPTAGRLRQTRPPARFDLTPAAIRCGAPRLGEHTSAILGELGYDAAEIDDLRARGIIGREPVEATAA
jgi:crotonobetainyl-CoA:carnitine CoA-transferase CaiB-like acyl-CoA transferase